MSFKRNDLCLLLDALEAIIEDFTWNGGLILAEDYMRMEERLRERLKSHDTTPFRTGTGRIVEKRERPPMVIGDG